MVVNMDLQSRFVNALRTQAKTADPPPIDVPCPHCPGRIFMNVEQLYSHAEVEHASIIAGLELDQARASLKDAALLFWKEAQALPTTGSTESIPDITNLSLTEGRQSLSEKKRPDGSDFVGRRGKGILGRTEIYDPDYSRPRFERERGRLFDPNQSAKGHASPYRSNSEWSIEANRGRQSQSPQPPLSPTRQMPHRNPASKQQSFSDTRQQLGIVGAEKYDPRYPGLLLQPDSRPISQEQLASEVKSIYAGLTMVEQKCIHVDRAQAAAVQDDPSSKLASDHWQALIALHRTLLHEHHDFFLASQHPSASPALRRLAAKYSMPARMWKHGIHSFLELLRRRLPESVDYMLAFIYLAYQMMALLYETVPAFEDTWIECLGDLGRYRMAIDDEDMRDRETWAGVARSWYSKAVDKSPSVGRLYHHLAILARPNALQQLYLYGRSLSCVKPFISARESVLTMLDPVHAQGPIPDPHVPSRRQQRYVPISTKGNHIEAFPDTGSQYDIISHRLVTQLDLKLNKAEALTMKMPTGRKIRTLGTVKLDIVFQGEKSKHKRTFHVLERSVHNMILGKSFLEITKTMTEFAYRIKSRLVALGSRIPRLHLTGSVTERIIGSINGIPTRAVDDTGSDVMVISWKEAERLGLQITTDHSHRTILEFVDGEEIYTDGAVLDVDWRFGHNTTGEAIKVDLQVVRDLTCNLILSNEVIFQANTYNNPDFFLVEERAMPVHNGYASLCVITDRSERKRTLDFLVKWLQSQPAETDVEDSELILKAERILDDEVARQLYQEEQINRLPEDEQDSAWAEEHEERRKWNQTHTTLNVVPPALRISGQPSVPSLASSSGRPASTSTGHGANASSPTLGKPTRWKRYFPKNRVKKTYGRSAQS